MILFSFCSRRLRKVHFNLLLSAENIPRCDNFQTWADIWAMYHQVYHHDDVIFQREHILYTQKWNP